MVTGFGPYRALDNPVRSGAGRVGDYRRADTGGEPSQCAGDAARVAWVGWSEVSGLAEVFSVGGRPRASDFSVELLA
jgi:hypothetical protein